MAENVTLLTSDNSYISRWALPVRSPIRGSLLLNTGAASTLLSYDLTTPWFGGVSAITPGVARAMISFAEILNITFSADNPFFYDVQVDVGDGSYVSILTTVILVAAQPPLIGVSHRVRSGDYLRVRVTRQNAVDTNIFAQSSMTAY